MARWEPDSRDRLVQAALALYAERGFENTTVAQIAERAGLTERTFFRHFADKREVLFGGSEEMQKLLASTVADAPDAFAPIEAVVAGLEAAAAELQERRDFARKRQAIIAASAELRERELIKLSTWATTLADTLRRRDVPDADANLAAEVGLAIFRAAFVRWIGAANDRPFPELLRESLDQLMVVTGSRTG